MFDEKNYLNIVATSIVVNLLVTAIIGGAILVNKGKIFSYFGQKYVEDVNSRLSKGENVNDSPITDEAQIIAAVTKANPAVVSVIISKDVPIMEQYFENVNPFPNFPGFPSDFFGGGFNIQVPQYRQKGTEKKDIGGGSGFIVSANGLIVTNNHVVSDKDASYTVFTNDGKKYPATVVAKDALIDVAVIKIIGTNFPYLKFGDSDKLRLGQSVIAIGNALGEFRNSVSVGVVSGLSRTITAGNSSGSESESLDQVIQTDAAINPGNSGGPLLDLRGNVVGVNVAVVSGSSNVGFSLPGNMVSVAVNSVEKNGKIVRPYIGIRYSLITEALKSKNNLTVDYGILVTRGQSADELAVAPGSPADKAGIVENDIILEIDGEKIDNTRSFASIIRKKNVGDTITLKILHKGETKTTKVLLDKFPEGGR